jgi:hypothetical protein
MWTLSLENGDFITGKCGFYHWKMGILSREHGDNHLKFPDFIMGDFKPSIVSGYRDGTCGMISGSTPSQPQRWSRGPPFVAVESHCDLEGIGS